MNKLLVICGPTATGKTKLAIHLAKKFSAQGGPASGGNGEIISADSRQVYKGMDIGTGKEWPTAQRASGPVGKIKIWGYDIADPKHDFSVSQYLKFAVKKIAEIEKKGKLPILVGGTGLYIKGVVDGIPTVDVPQNKKLRKILEEKTANELYEMLSQIDSMKAASLNSSDRKNPRRLVRAVEVATWMIDNGKKFQMPNAKYQMPNSVLFVGLSSSKEKLDENISKRVDERIKMGIKDEIKNLIKSGINWDNQSMMSLGYREWRDYFEGRRPVGPMALEGAVPEENVIEEWKKDERKYAKRQMTWFKKDKRVVWFDISNPNYVKNVEKLAETWLNTGNAKKS